LGLYSFNFVVLNNLFFCTNVLFDSIDLFFLDFNDLLFVLDVIDKSFLSVRIRLSVS